MVHEHLHVSLSFLPSTRLISDNILTLIIKYCNDCLQNNLSVCINTLRIIQSEPITNTTFQFSSPSNINICTCKILSIRVHGEIHITFIVKRQAQEDTVNFT